MKHLIIQAIKANKFVIKLLIYVFISDLITFKFNWT